MLSTYKDEIIEGIVYNKRHNLPFEVAEDGYVSTVLSKLMGLKPILAGDIYNILEKFTVYDTKKIAIASLIIDKWSMMKIGTQNVYVKHIMSPEQNTLYQIVLGYGDNDGVYKLEFKGMNFEMDVVKTKLGKKLILNCPANYDIARVPKVGNIIRGDFKDDDKFLQKLIDNKLITDEEADIYFEPDEVIEPYLLKTLPKIEFC